ncbi:MAG: hypothetical protein OYL97_10830 [Candidatus Poribacteria bacterium]|nr:hypothetical protein [Candidatus Poribacteria bacterium]MDE0467542.1 hypothetical protein [Candidatus Poribacteria bacterium]
MFKNLQFLIGLMVILFLSPITLHAVSLKTLSLDFKRERTENNKTEHIAGTLHYDLKKWQVVIEVMEPLTQIMVAKENVLEIYYPERKQAFRFISKGPVPLPLVESIIQTTQAEYGLTSLMGYTLDKHDVVDKVLYTYWKPPEKEKRTLGSVILGMRDDRLISAEVKNPRGHLVARTLYQNHSKMGLNYIPMTVTATAYGEKSELLRHEQIVYSNPQMNVTPPNPILNFRIPESVKIQEVKW